MTTQRYHKIAEEPKQNYDLPEPERHRYSELDVTNEALCEYLFQLSIDPQRNQPLNRDRAHVATKLLYRLEEHHKMARDGRPHYPPFSWKLVERFAKTPPFTYQEYSTPLAGGELGLLTNADVSSDNPRAAPAPHQEDTT